MLPAAMFKSFLRRPGVQAGAAHAVSAYLMFALRTTRWTMEGEAEFAPFGAGRPAIVAFWHETLPLMPAMWLRARRDRARISLAPGRMHVLVSRHSDGRFIGEVVRRMGCDLVYGSSSKRGADRGGQEASRVLSELLAGGDQAVITPDGPRGPRRVAARGVAQIAGRAGVPVVPVAAASTRMRRLATWDRMMVPLPWGRGVLVCGAPIVVEKPDGALPAIAAALTAAAERAEALCR